jgi:hypothetical protein
MFWDQSSAILLEASRVPYAGQLWVETEFPKYSRFSFTTTFRISQSSIDSTLSKISPFVKKTILFVNIETLPASSMGSKSSEFQLFIMH